MGDFPRRGIGLGVMLVLWTAPAAPADDETFDLLESNWQGAALESGTIRIAAGTLRAQRRSYQSATILTAAEYENFNLDFEFRVGRWCELLFLIHAPWNGAHEAGLQLVLSDHHGRAPGPDAAGALLGHVAPRAVAVYEDGEWNDCRVEMDWPRLVVSINGVIVQQLQLDEHPALRHKLRRGHLGFQDLLGWGFEVRNMRFEPLPDTEGGVRLFNGRDLGGWKEVRRRDARWKVENNAITGYGGNGYLQHERAVQDFDLRLYYRTTPTANGGVFFRWMSDDSDRGNEIQILDVPEITMPSASIYGLSRADVPHATPEQWHLLQMRVEGNHAVTHLDGRKAAESSGLTKIRPGHITLQMHKENSAIEFRDFVLVPLDEPVR